MLLLRRFTPKGVVLFKILKPMGALENIVCICFFQSQMSNIFMYWYCQNVFTIHILFLEHVSGNNISSKEIWYIFAWSSHLVFDSSTWLCHFIYVKDWNFIFLTSCVLLNRITNNLLRIVLLTWMNTLMLQPINLFIVVCKWFTLIKETLIEFHIN